MEWSMIVPVLLIAPAGLLPAPLAHTFSIVARDPATGEMGVAVRMLQALEAAQKAGGDIRGKQSAAILIVRARSTGKPWADKVVDLRIEDSTDPLKELRRLVRLRRAYNLEDAGDNFIAEKKP